jgi:hypothetical protein
MKDRHEIVQDIRWDGWRYTQEHFQKMISRISFHQGVQED